MTTNSPNPVDGNVQALNELVAAFYPQYGTPGSRDVDITARRKVIDQSAAAIAEAFRELQQEKSRLEDIARHANRGWKHAYETTKRAEAAEAEVQRLNATAQPVSDWQKEAERMAELHGMSFVVFRNGGEPKCADPTKVRIEFTDKGLGYPAAPGGQDA